MSSDRQSRLLRLVESISDELPVDWQEVRVRETGGELPLNALERISAVAAGYRQMHRREPQDSEPHAAERSPLFLWGHLEILEVLGEGSFGQVYRAFDPVLERDVAVKLRAPGPTPDRGSGRRFIEEARRLAKVRHPNVMAIYGADRHDGRVGLWTELIAGMSLEDWLQRAGTLGAQEALSIGLDLCRALAAVHAAGLAHGDVKAANVLREEGGRIVLADFGAGSELASEPEAGAPVHGSPLTMAPEVLAGKAPSAASDLYSLGVLLYRLASGRHPVEAESVGELLEKHGHGERLPLRDLRPELPTGFVEVVERALDGDPERRFSSAGAMERALTAALDREPGGPREAESPAPQRPPSVLGAPVAPYRRYALVALAGMAAAILLVVVLVSSRGRGSDSTAKSTRAATASPASSSERPGSRLGTGDASLAESAMDPVPVTPDVEAHFYRVRGGHPQPLRQSDEVRPGDQLFLEVEMSEAAHFYVVNEDQEGAVYVLFPIPGADLANPLPPGRRHRLPSADQDWQVTSSGGTESFLLVASRARLEGLERQLAALETVSSSRAIEESAALPAESDTLRGVGGLVAALGSDSGGRLAALLRQLQTEEAQDEELWLQRFELSNPAGSGL